MDDLNTDKEVSEETVVNNNKPKDDLRIDYKPGESDEDEDENENEDLDFDFSNLAFEERAASNNKHKPKGLHAPRVNKTAKNDALRIIAKALKKRARFIVLVSLGLLAICIIIASILFGSKIALKELFICSASAVLGMMIYLITSSLFFPYESQIFDQLIKLSRIQFNELWDTTMDAADELGGSSHREQVKDYIYYLFLKADLAKSAWQNYDY